MGKPGVICVVCRYFGYNNQCRNKGRYYMLLKYKYKLKPHKRQAVIISNWLEMTRKQYNYRLAERLNWFEATRTPVNACPLNVSVVPVERIYHAYPRI